MPMKQSLIAIAAWLFLGGGLANGQDLVEPPPPTEIGGYSVQCRDVRGHNVSMMKVKNLGDLASAFSSIACRSLRWIRI